MRERLRGLETIAKMHEGFQLGRSQDGAWLQRELMCGGDSYNVHKSAFNSLYKAGAIVHERRHAGDPFWLSRYKLPTDRLTVDAPSGRVAGMKTKQRGFVLSLPVMMPAVVLAFVAVCYVALGWFAVFGS